MKQRISVTQLAEEMECSEKTIRRDIQEMELEYGAPWIIHDNHVICGSPKHQSIQLEGYWFTSQELNTLLVLNHTLSGLPQGVLTQQLKAFKEKVIDLLGNTTTALSFINKIKLLEKSPRVIEASQFNRIVESLQSATQIQISYWDRNNDRITIRRLSPQQLVRYRDRWLLDAWCHQKNAIRTFSLDAIQQIELTKQAIYPVSKEELKQHFETSYGIFAGEASQQAVIRFTPFIARWIQNEIWHPDQQACWLKDGSYQVSIPYQNDTELVQDLMKYGAEVEVIQPKELREKIKLQLKKALSLYSRDKNCP
jgi:predicted DNA-binding transcriptional regulator YafY